MSLHRLRLAYARFRDAIPQWIWLQSRLLHTM